MRLTRAAKFVGTSTNSIYATPPSRHSGEGAAQQRIAVLVIDANTLPLHPIKHVSQSSRPAWIYRGEMSDVSCYMISELAQT
jgi:hypothetical protein